MEEATDKYKEHSQENRKCIQKLFYIFLWQNSLTTL